MREFSSYILETYTDFSYVYERVGFIPRLLGRNYRYVCYLYEPEKTKADKVVRGFTKTREDALKKINDIVLEWRERPSQE